MAEAEVAAVIAAEETERREGEQETAVEIAELHAETEQHRADADVEIAEAHAEAAVGVAEAEARGREEWRGELQRIEETLASLAASQAAMAEAIASMATPSTPTPPSVPEEPTLVVVTEEAPPAESPEDASAGDHSEAETSHTGPAETERRGRIRRAM